MNHWNLSDKQVSSSKSQKRDKSSDGKEKIKKVIRCRFCDFATQERQDSYDHLKLHYAPQQLHVCKYDDCKFVTVHKHHYKYHESSHTGYKPIQCPLCTYRCVNQSMLTSHLKSHSNNNELKFNKQATGELILDLRVDSKRFP